MRLAEALPDALHDAAAREILGLPGDVALPDFPIAEETGLGGDGYRATTRSEPWSALTPAAATRGRFQPIEAVDRWGRVSRTLARFVPGVKLLRGQGRGPSGRASL